MVQECSVRSTSLVPRGKRLLTDRIWSVWGAGCKHSYTLAIELWHLHFGLQAAIISSPQILQVSIAMEDVDDPAMTVALQAIKTGMWYAWPALPLYAEVTGFQRRSMQH